jgi:hypothetical protein
LQSVSKVFKTTVTTQRSPLVNLKTLKLDIVDPNVEWNFCSLPNAYGEFTCSGCGKSDRVNKRTEFSTIAIYNQAYDGSEKIRVPNAVFYHHTWCTTICWLEKHSKWFNNGFND